MYRPLTDKRLNVHQLANNLLTGENKRKALSAPYLYPVPVNDIQLT